MAWQTPAIGTLVTDTVRAFNAHLPGADASLVRNNLRPTAKVIAGGLFDLHRFAAWAAAQRFVLTCDADQLDRHGAEMKPPVPRKPAAAARGFVDMTGDPGATIATGALLTRSDGVAYLVEAGAVLGAGGSAAIPVRAQIAGAAGAAAAATTLAASAGLTGTASFAVAAAGLGGAADREDDGAYRARLLFAKAYPDHAGAPADWVRYAMAVPGVTRVFIDPLGHGRGTVVVYPFFDTTRAHGIGLESDRQAVLSALLIAGPGAAQPVVSLPQPVPVDVSYGGLDPATPEVRMAVAAELATMFYVNSRVCGYAQPHPSMPFLATPTSFSRSWLWQAAANASGEQRHTLLSPVSDIPLSPGQTAVLGAVAFG